MGRQVVIPQRSAHSGAEGGAAADADKKEGAYWSRELVVPSRSRQVSRFWLEKALVLTDGVQLFALMWQLSQPWPWPARWLEATRWVNAFTLDVFSFRATGAAMGSTSQPFSLWGRCPTTGSTRSCGRWCRGAACWRCKWPNARGPGRAGATVCCSV